MSVREKICAECGISFSCGSENDHSCWCNNYPGIMPMDQASGCYCPGCLKKVMQRKIAEYIDQLKSGREDIAKIRKYATSDQLMEDIDYYIDEDGKYVFTEWYLLKRGYCCENGCRHCPYGFSKQLVS